MSFWECHLGEVTLLAKLSEDEASFLFHVDSENRGYVRIPRNPW